MTMPTITATRPPGSPPGRRTLAVQAISTIANETNAIQGTSHIWNAGRIEMNAIEMPASVPSIAARGVWARIHGPDERAEQHDHADDEAPREPGLPGEHWRPWS